MFPVWVINYEVGFCHLDMIHLTYLLATLFSAVTAGYDSNAIIVGNDFFEEEFNGNLKYSECGGSQSLIKLKKLKTYPLQYTIPENVSVSIEYSILKKLSAPIKVDLTVSKEIPLLGYQVLPCVGVYGSCKYAKSCDILDTYPRDSFEYKVVCPKWMEASGLKCKCPFEKGHYKAKDVMVPVEDVGIPKWISAGNYKITLKIIEGEKMAGCFNFQFRLL